MESDTAREFPPGCCSISVSPTTTRHSHFRASSCVCPVVVQQHGGEDRASRKRLSMVVGPWGGDGGTSWDDGSYSGVREIAISHSDCINWIRVLYDRNGKPVGGQKHGGVGGSNFSEIKLQYPDEVLIGASGHYRPMVFEGSPVIRSLTFKSNQRTFGPFGVEEGTPFSLSMDAGQIVGFQGRRGWYLDAIGFHLSNTQSKKLFQKIQQQLQKFKNMVISAPKHSDDTQEAKKNKSIRQ